MKLKQTATFEEYADRYDQWYDKHSAVFESEVNAIRQQLLKLPANIHGIEIGLGSGRFAVELGIKEGIEPSDNLRQKAINRDIEVMDGRAEQLPYGDMQFDFVLFVTICYLEDLRRAFAQAFRVLKNQGSIIIGFIDKDQPIGQSYIKRREHSLFYRHAQFYSVDLVSKKLKEAGFKDLEYVQTLFGEIGEIKTIQEVKEGYGEGGFVVIKATKKV